MKVEEICKSLNSMSFKELELIKMKIDECIVFKNGLSIEDFVDFQSEFVESDSAQHKSIMSELAGLDFKPTTNKAATKWLTSTGEDYVWSSSKGKLTVKEPLNISEQPGIRHLMNDINNKFGVTMNSCLVSYYKSGDSGTSYHSDDESSLDSSQGIYVVSFGADRVLDLVPKGKDMRTPQSYMIKPVDCSLYVMKPGCQDHFAHRVRTESNVRGERYSLSFRHMIAKKASSTEEIISASGNVPSLLQNTLAPASSTGTSTTVTSTQSETEPASAPPSLPPKQSSLRHKPKIRKTNALFGSSMTKFIRTKNFSFRGKNLINISQSGAKIKDLIKNVIDFYENDVTAKNDDIEKVILSIGTNDVKYCKFGVDHLRKYFVELIEVTKSLFPASIVVVQCCLPIICTSNNLHVARNVVNFNRMIKDVCFQYNCVFLDCFRDFLTRDLSQVNSNLYHDWLHLNKTGVGALCTWLKFIVNENSFDRVVDNLLGI